jgi:hypothetical protein
MNCDFPFRLEIRGHAKSQYTREQVDTQLAKLAGKTDEASTQQRAFLEQLKARKYGRDVQH